MSNTKIWGSVFTLRTSLFQNLTFYPEKAIFQNIKHKFETQLMLLPRGHQIIKSFWDRIPIVCEERFNFFIIIPTALKENKVKDTSEGLPN